MLPIKFGIDLYFFHQKLILEILSKEEKDLLDAYLNTPNQYPDNLAKLFIANCFLEAALSSIRRQKVKSLDEVLLNGNYSVGQLVWFESDFFFNGVVKAKNASEAGKNPSYAYFHTTLKRFSNLKIEGKFNVEHTHTTSALDKLSGKANRFIFGYIQDAPPEKIEIRPIIIGDKLILKKSSFNQPTDRLQIDLEEIDEFAEATKIPVRSKGLVLTRNKEFPENQIKSWIAEILHEGNVSKDWGGEYSDLFTNHLHVGGRRYNAAFLLKGPSKFHKMRMNDLGANGNQLIRLYEEPADILIVQHCHYVDSEIYKMMRALSGNFARPSRFCIIDGIDTLRLLAAYDKIVL